MTLHPEITLIRQALTEFGYVGIGPSLSHWYPRHCFGDTDIVFTVFSWKLSHEGVHAEGHGFRELMVEMAKLGAQPFERVERVERDNDPES